MNQSRTVYSAAAVGAVMLAACLVHWYYRRRNQTREGNVVESQLIYESCRAEQSEREAETQIKSATLESEAIKKPNDGEDESSQIPSPHETRPQEIETTEELGGSESYSLEAYPVINVLDRIPLSCSEKTTTYITFQPRLPRVQKQETEDEEDSLYKNWATLPDVQQRESEAEDSESEKPTTTDEDEMQDVKNENEHYSSSSDENSRPQEVVEQTDEEKKRETARIEALMIEAIENDPNDEDIPPEGALLKIASEVVLSDERNGSLSDLERKIVQGSFVSDLGLIAESKSYASASVALQALRVKIIERMLDVSWTDYLIALSSYYISRQCEKDSDMRKRAIIKGCIAAYNAYSSLKELASLRWLAVLNFEKLRYLENRSKYTQFHKVHVSYEIEQYFYFHQPSSACTLTGMVLGVIRTSTEDEYLITHFRGRLLYEFVHYVVNERGGKLVNQSKLLRKAITCFEDACSMFYPSVFIESLYYLACCLILQGEKEKAKKLLPYTERLCLYDQTEADYLYELKKMLM